MRHFFIPPSMLAVAWLVAASLNAAAQTPTAPAKTQQETMAERGYVRYRGGWRTAQEIELLERAERAHLARAEWKQKLERLRRQLLAPQQRAHARHDVGGVHVVLDDVREDVAVEPALLFVDPAAVARRMWMKPCTSRAAASNPAHTVSRCTGVSRRGARVRLS